MTRPSCLSAAGAVLLGALFVGFSAQAQDTAGYPARPVKIIVPFAPAGPTDTMALLAGSPGIDAGGTALSGPPTPCGIGGHA